MHREGGDEVGISGVLQCRCALSWVEMSLWVDGVSSMGEFDLHLHFECDDDDAGVYVVVVVFRRLEKSRRGGSGDKIGASKVDPSRL